MKLKLKLDFSPQTEGTPNIQAIYCALKVIIDNTLIYYVHIGRLSQTFKSTVLRTDMKQWKKQISEIHIFALESRKDNDIGVKAKY